MSSDPEQPDWDLLPHDAETFFGLESGFDRRDLKRAYNRFVKRFKPEKFPAEFQRIRAAYEGLDQALRYGSRRGRSEPIARYEWVVPEIEDVPEPPAPKRQPRSDTDPSRPDTERSRQHRLEPERPQPTPLHERLRTQPPEDLYRELRRTEHKQPYHYYVLAILSDVVAEAEHTFLDWLLEGYREYPRDPALFALLHRYLRDTPPTQSLPSILESISRAVPDDRFFSLTEKLWDDLLATAPFKVFRATLSKCERNLQDHQVAGRIVFYVHVLRRALFKASRKWIGETFALLDEHMQEIPPHLEYDLEFLDVMRNYLRHRGRFLDGDPLRSEIDELLETYCQSDEFGGEQAFLGFQVRLVDRIDDLLEAFPVDEEEDLEFLFDVWKWMHFEVRERTADGDEEFDVSEPFVHSVYDMLQSIEEDTKRTAAGRAWNWSVWIYIGLGILAVLLVVVLAGVLGLRQSGLLGLIVLVVGGVGGYFLKQHVLDPFWRRHCETMATTCYRKHWRRSVAAFLLRTHAPIWVVSSVVDYLVENVDGLDDGNTSWLPGFINGDAALVLYSTALPFVK